VTRDGRLLDIIAPAFTNNRPGTNTVEIEWTPWPKARKQEDSGMLFLSAMITYYTRNQTSLYKHRHSGLISKVKIQY